MLSASGPIRKVGGGGGGGGVLSASGPIRKAGGGGAVRFRPDTKSGGGVGVCLCVCAVHFRHNSKGGGVA